MNLIPAKSSAEFFAHAAHYDRFLQGRSKTVPFAEAYDDGSRKFSALEVPDDLNQKQEADRLPELFRSRSVGLLTAALKRDAQHRTASRLELMRHGVRLHALRSFDAGFVLTTVKL